jgi:hypothetical protein
MMKSIREWMFEKGMISEEDLSTEAVRMSLDGGSKQTDGYLVRRLRPVINLISNKKREKDGKKYGEMEPAEFAKEIEAAVLAVLSGKTSGGMLSVSGTVGKINNMGNTMDGQGSVKAPGLEDPIARVS